MRSNWNPTKIRRWSAGAAECFNRKLNCNYDCSNYSYCKRFSEHERMAPMKQAVIELIRCQIPIEKKYTAIAYS